MLLKHTCISHPGIFHHSLQPFICSICQTHIHMTIAETLVSPCGKISSILPLCGFSGEIDHNVSIVADQSA